MLRPRFYTSQTLSDAPDSITLESEPSRHIAKSLRMRVGDSLCLFDGTGREVTAEIAAIEKNSVHVSHAGALAVSRESRLNVTLLISLSRGDRMDTVVQKATELGVNRIVPLISERTGVRLDENRLARKRDHWEKIAISACEQCGRNTLPIIEATIPFDDALTLFESNSSLKLALYPTASAASLPEECDDVTLLIGPEGGFSDRELNAAVASGFEAFLLGPRVLRTETAPLAAIAVMQARWGDLLA
ncbi:MAG: 16S rRNA (uracil(1498)-N(3))-methyltransferase [Pseudomonadota bacterium]